MFKFKKERNGLDVFEQHMLGEKLVKALQVFKNHKTMTAEELENEFWDLQWKLNAMTEEQAESFEGEVLCNRQRLVHLQFEELTHSFLV